MAILTIFIQLLSSLCGAAVDVSQDTFYMHNEDKYFLGCIENWSYGKGAVWMRPCETKPGFNLYYRPEGGEHLPSMKPSCYVCYVSQDKECWDKPLKVLLETVSDFFYSNCALFESYISRHYALPLADALCAAVTGIKENLSGQYLYNGVEHPDFESWARHIPEEELHTKQGNRTIWTGHTGGAIWISEEQDDQYVLCYQPECGPRWLCYRYDLAQNKGWPKLWLKELQVVKNFALSQKAVFDEGCCEDIPALVASVQMALGGQGARFHEGVSAWGTLSCFSCWILKARMVHHVVRGGGDAEYKKGSAWIVPLPTQYLFRARTQDNELFQITHTREHLDDTPPDAQTQWVQQAVQFILGSEDRVS